MHAGESSVTRNSSDETIENTIMYSHTALARCDIIATQNERCKTSAINKMQIGSTWRWHGSIKPFFRRQRPTLMSGARMEATFDEFIIPTVHEEEKRVLPIRQRTEKNKKSFIMAML